MQEESMIRKKREMRILAGLVLALLPLSAFAWGQKGHDTVANIASQHLTEATRAAVDSLFKGKDMVYWANWLDNASHTPQYEYSRTWHYKNIDPEYTFETAPENSTGDILKATNEQISVLMDPDTRGADAKLALKMVIHFLGDMHQPLHMGRYKDRGGNYHKVKFFDQETNLHSVWDSRLPETGHKWSYTEWTRQIDRASQAEQDEIISGTVGDWCRETYEIAKDVYGKTPEGTTISYDYIAGWTPTVELQFLRGGLRLAHVLNYIYDPAYRATHSSPQGK